MTSDAKLLDIIDRWGGKTPEQSLGVAVSGGSDSTALLHLAAGWGGARVSAVTVDHGLRAEAAHEIASVAAQCDALGVEHSVLKWDWDGQGNLQDRARRARYRLMAQWAKDAGVKTVLLGHTRDDVAETFLMRLAREAGVDGLSRMDDTFHEDGVRFSRPFLDVDRADLRAYLTRHQVGWSEDASNDDERFDRVKARKALAALKPLGIETKTLSRVALNMASVRMNLQSAAMNLAEELVEFQGGDLVINDIRALRSGGLEISRRIIAGALTFIGGMKYQPRYLTVMEAQSSAFTGRTNTAHGCLITSDKTQLRLSREHNAVKDKYSATTELWDDRWEFSGPHSADLEIRALGDVGLVLCPNWRDMGLPRTSLLASPAVWRGEELVAAPLAGFGNGWCARLTRYREQFLSSLLSH